MEIRLNKINLSEKTLKVTKYSIWKELSYKYLNNSNNLQRPFTYSVLFELVNSSIKEGGTGRLLPLSYTLKLLVQVIPREQRSVHLVLLSNLLSLLHGVPLAPKAKCSLRGVYLYPFPSCPIFFLLMVSYTLIAQYITSVGNGKCLSNK